MIATIILSIRLMLALFILFVSPIYLAFYKDEISHLWFWYITMTLIWLFGHLVYKLYKKDSE